VTGVQTCALPILLKSTDSGASWSELNTGMPYSSIRVLAIDPATPSTLYSGVGGVYKYTPETDPIWLASDTGLPDPGSDIVRILSVDPITPTTLYASTLSSGIYKSADAGANWVAINNNLPNLEIRAFVFDPVNPNILYLAPGGRLF